MPFQAVFNSNAVQDPVDGARAVLRSNKERETWVALDLGPVKGFQLLVDRERAPDAYVIDGIRPTLLLDARKIAGQFSFRSMTDAARNTEVVRRAIDALACLNSANPIGPNPIFYTNYGEVLASGVCLLRFNMPSNYDLLHLTK